MEEKAARAYDLAALKYWGPSTHINFSVCFNSGGISGSKYCTTFWSPIFYLVFGS